MTTDADILAALSEPFPADKVSFRVGATNKDKTKGIALAYIDARDVMDRLDEVMGIDGWQDGYVETPKGVTVCALALLINGNWVTKSDGAGQTDVEGEKGGLSDAFKRAAVKFGVGRYLYRLGTSWVPIKPQGRSYVLAAPPSLPSWALPSNVVPIKREEPTRSDPPPEEPETPAREENVSKKDKAFDRIVKYLEQLTDIVGESETQERKVNCFKHNPEFCHGHLDLGTVYKHATATELWRLSDTVKEMVETTIKNKENENG